MSHYFKQNRSEYYERLQRVRDFGEWEEWIRFFLIGVVSVSREATETARAIVRLREAHRSKVTSMFGRSAGNGLMVLEKLFEHPIVSVRWVRELLGVTNPAANSLVQRFLDEEILRETTGQKRYRVFRYEPYVALFA